MSYDYSCFIRRGEDNVFMDVSYENAPTGCFHAAICSSNKEHGTALVIRQIKYLNNIVEQDHRGVKRVTRPMLGCKSFNTT